MTEHPSVCLSIGELSDYWTEDVSPDDLERIEAHVFACRACTQLLADADRLRRSIGDVPRALAAFRPSSQTVC